MSIVIEVVVNVEPLLHRGLPLRLIEHGDFEVEFVLGSHPVYDMRTAIDFDKTVANARADEQRETYDQFTFAKPRGEANVALEFVDGREVTKFSVRRLSNVGGDELLLDIPVAVAEAIATRRYLAQSLLYPPSPLSIEPLLSKQHHPATNAAEKLPDYFDFIHDNERGYGIVTRVPLMPGVFIGQYTGRVLTHEPKDVNNAYVFQSYTWQKGRRVPFWIDGSNAAHDATLKDRTQKPVYSEREQQSNWVRYINSVDHGKVPNVAAITFYSAVYLFTRCKIAANEELLLDYSNLFTVLEEDTLDVRMYDNHSLAAADLARQFVFPYGDALTDDYLCTFVVKVIGKGGTGLIFYQTLYRKGNDDFEYTSPSGPYYKHVADARELLKRARDMMCIVYSRADVMAVYEQGTLDHYQLYRPAPPQKNPQYKTQFLEYTDQLTTAKAKKQRNDLLKSQRTVICSIPGLCMYLETGDTVSFIALNKLYSDKRIAEPIVEALLRYLMRAIIDPTSTKTFAYRIDDDGFFHYVKNVIEMHKQYVQGVMYSYEEVRTRGVVGDVRKFKWLPELRSPPPTNAECSSSSSTSQLPTAKSPKPVPSLLL